MNAVSPRTKSGKPAPMSEESAPPGDMFPKRVGERLADIRKKKKLDLSDIANRTRIPQRHLEALEAGNYSELPASTYAVGFAKSYARALDVDEVGIARDMRAELDIHGGRPAMPEHFEPADPARVPPRPLVWTALAVALLIAIGYGIWRASIGDDLEGRDPNAIAAGIENVEPVTGNPQQAPGPAQPATAPIGGEVVLTATDAVWVRITDADGGRLFEKEMARGERFAVPAAAREPKIQTGRPNALQVTVGGRAMPPLGPPETLITNVGISAAALAARPPEPGTVSPPAP